MNRWLLCVMLGCLLAPSALAHRFAPSLLKLTEIAPQHYQLLWKTPAQGVSNVPLAPRWPEACNVENAAAPQLEGTGVVTSLQLRCEGLGREGLVGQQLGIDGLSENQASARPASWLYMRRR